MISRFEYNVQTQSRVEVFQRVYRNEEGDTLVLDDGVKCPDGYSEVDVTSGKERLNP
jgi:hypothetical protein